jgi:hypothetical protein
MTNQPTLHATAYENNIERGTLIKFTKTHLWIDRSQQAGQPWTSKYKRSYRDWTFEANPLVEFMLNGIEDTQ